MVADALSPEALAVADAWRRWEASPADRRAAGEMQDACNRLAAILDVGCSRLRATLVGHRAAGFSTAVRATITEFSTPVDDAVEKPE